MSITIFIPWRKKTFICNLRKKKHYPTLVFNQAPMKKALTEKSVKRQMISHKTLPLDVI